MVIIIRLEKDIVVLTECILRQCKEVAMKRYIKASIDSNGYVGIWWLYYDKLIGDYCPLEEGEKVDNYIQFGNADDLDKILKQSLPSKYNEIVEHDYVQLEPGKVVYNTTSDTYEIICTPHVAINKYLIQIVAKAFGIADLKYKIKSSSSKS